LVRVHPCVAGCVCGGPWLIGIPVSAGDLAGGLWSGRGETRRLQGRHCSTSRGGWTHGWRVPVHSVWPTDLDGHRKVASSGVPGSAGAPAGSAGVNCLISTVDGSRRTPGVRQCAQRHGPRASLPASTSKALLQRFPGLTGRRWRVPVHSVRLTNTGRFASASSVMVRGHPCPHWRISRCSSAEPNELEHANDGP